eukprot:1142848-Pelagomonas_calceolata.AAC.2
MRGGAVRIEHAAARCSNSKVPRCELVGLDDSPCMVASIIHGMSGAAPLRTCRYKDSLPDCSEK